MSNNIRKKKLSIRDDKINNFAEKYGPEIHEIDNNVRNKIFKSDASEIFADICIHKSYTSRTVVLLFCMASINATKLTNCLTEIMFDEAICRAEFLDNYLLTERRPFGPFHGIPFSLKDTFDVADYGNIYL